MFNMARMYPQQLPMAVLQDKKKASEVKVYEQLKRLSDEYVVFHSTAWLVRSKITLKPEDTEPWIDAPPRKVYPMGEADFIVLHPRKGILVLEVKGGRLRLDGGSWKSCDRHNVWHDIHNPLEQVKRNLFSLLGKLREHPKLSECSLQVGYGVIVPDCEVSPESMGPDAPSSVFAFHSHMGELAKRVDGMLNYWHHVWQEWSQGRQGELSSQAVQLIVEYLAPSLELRRPSLKARISEQQEEILHLTERQFSILQFLSRQKRALIGGGAGTGKTLLAVEKARQLAKAGYKTLFTCSNKLLAAHAQHLCGSQENLTITHFHQLCFEWAKKAGVKLEQFPPSTPPERLQQYFDREMPDKLLQALDSVSERFDAIVVDEGQDFYDEWWEVLLFCLKNPEDDVFYIFFDDNQNIWNEKMQYPFSLSPYFLTENLRNARTIHELLKNYFHGDAYEGAGPEGGSVRFLPLSSKQDQDALEDALAKLLQELVKKEKVQLKDIAILTGKRQQNSLLASVDRLGGYPLTQNLYEEQAVVSTSIRRFKGMEKPVVILVELEELLEEGCLLKGLKDTLLCYEDLHGLAKGMLYVGMSRAQSCLYVLGEETILETIC